MLHTQQRPRCLMSVFLLFTSINFCYTQISTAKFHPWNIEIIVINSTSTINFTCIKHESNDKPLEVNLSKIIPSTEIKITTNILNKTAINIQLEAKNYVGIFHLLCYINGEKSKGTRSDVIVR
ncbi:unnamed protein product, partial [Rotaria sp. Silwood2]